jgi:hypothetical protein
LGDANLQHAGLFNANLQHANLSGANLQHAQNIKTVQFDEKTVLPDAILLTDEYGFAKRDEDDNPLYDKYWTTETDMTRYTHPEHPDFWEPDWVKRQRDE